MRVQITLLTYKDTGNGRCTGIIQDLVVHCLDHFETGARSNGVHQNVAMDTDSMLRIQDGVLILTGRVDNIAAVLLALVLNRLLKYVFDRGVVRVHERIFHVTHHQRRFAFS